MARKYPEGYYVYLHIRKTDGQIFYVGIGKEYRAWAKTGRNNKWDNVFKKHGRDVDILVGNISREDALHYEVEIISYYRSLGLDLANKTDGGDGCSGLCFDDDSKVKMSRSQGGKVVHCSNGMSFETGQKAAEWLNNNGQPNALSGHISACYRGERTAAYGYAWWYDGNEKKDYIPRYERLSITSSTNVYCSNGMVFRNATYAAEWLKKIGKLKASRSGIEGAISGKYLMAYGFSWWREGQEPKSMIVQEFRKAMIMGRRIIMDDNTCFFNLEHAVYHLRKNGNPKAAKSSLVKCAQGSSGRAYGHTWKYADEQD